jgi:hypothetical protein
MSIQKLIFPDAFDFGMPTASLVPLHSRGIDDGWLHKRAAMFDNDMGDFERKKGHQYIHLISVGAWERYGPNNNADAFIRKSASHTCPHPKDSSRKTIHMTGGLVDFHDKTFMANGKVYKNHVNRHKDGVPSGYIVKAAYNDSMDRGELIIGVDEKKWRNELQKVANDEAIYFSMGSDCPEDICSYCHNEAHKLEDYCDHLTKYAMQIANDGTQVCALTQRAFFHDISGVGRPAEKICFGLRKVASEGVITGAQLAEMYSLTPPSHMFPEGTTLARKYDLLQKLAKIEKEILMSSDPEPGIEAFCPGSGFGDVDEKIVDRMSNEDPHAVLGALKRYKVILPADVFFRMIMGDKFADIETDMDDVKASLPGIMGRLLDNSNLSQILGDGSYEPSDCIEGHVGQDAKAMMPECSIHTEPIRVRVVRAVLNGAPVGGKTIIEKKASSFDDRAEMLATEYASYLLSFANGLTDSEQRLSVAQLCAKV